MSSVGDRRLILSARPTCNKVHSACHYFARAQTSESNICLSYYEHQCAGICSSESRLEPIFRSCLDDPLHQRQPEGKGSESAGAVAE